MMMIIVPDFVEMQAKGHVLGEALKFKPTFPGFKAKFPGQYHT